MGREDMDDGPWMRTPQGPLLALHVPSHYCVVQSRLAAPLLFTSAGWRPAPAPRHQKSTRG